jgi:stearoyl-CoA desaturase (delta-9 desaturase)
MDFMNRNKKILSNKHESVEWIKYVPYFGIQIMVLGVFLVPLTWACVILAVLSYSVRMFAITAFYHRYFSHRTFKASRITQTLGAAVGCSAGQRGPLWWAAHHRIHHRQSDTDEDQHSPQKKGFMWSHMLWFMTVGAKVTPVKEVPDLHKLPELRFLNRFHWIPVVLLATSCYLLGETDWAANNFAATGIQWLIWGFIVPTTALYHATYTVNSLAHLFGKRRFRTKDDSRNNFFVALITLGEGWHNNHHFFPGSVRQGFTKWELDPTYWGLKMMSYMGLVSDLSPIPAWVQTKVNEHEEDRRRK